MDVPFRNVPECICLWMDIKQNGTHLHIQQSPFYILLRDITSPKASSSGNSSQIDQPSPGGFLRHLTTHPAIASPCCQHTNPGKWHPAVDEQIRQESWGLAVALQKNINLAGLSRMRQDARQTSSNYCFCCTILLHASHWVYLIYLDLKCLLDANRIVSRPPRSDPESSPKSYKIFI